MSMNKWKRRFLKGFPIEPPLSRFVDLPPRHPDLVLCAHIADAASEFGEADIEIVIHRLIEEALGKRAFARAQQHQHEGSPLEPEAAFICSRAARMLCYEWNSTRVPTSRDVACRVHALLRTPAEREQANRMRRWKTFVRAAKS